VSRLWLERRTLALFPEQSWLQLGKQQWTGAGIGADAASCFAAADALLSHSQNKSRLRPRLDVLLSDEAASVIALPWQDGLRTSAQQLCYAEACLEDAGMRGHGWAVQYVFRRYGCDGMAFAVPTDRLEQLVTLATAHRLRLGSVLPVSAAAYWRQPLRSRAASLLILQEPRRFTSLQFAERRLASVDVQPIVDDKEMALRRLLRRVQIQAPAMTEVRTWSAIATLNIAPLVAESYPAARLHVLDQKGLT